MGLSEAQVSGGIGDIAEAVDKASPVLGKFGIDGHGLSVELLADRKACERADADQEDAKRVLRKKTEVKEDLYHRLWVKGSGYLDMVIAAVGKDSDDAKNFRRIRSRIARPPADESAEPLPEPVPGRTQ